jgi:adenine-specific DNA-methyltransferase
MEKKILTRETIEANGWDKLEVITADMLQGLGVRKDYNRSLYSIKGKVADEFEKLIQGAQFKYIFLSYNNEGLMSMETVRNIMSKYGTYGLKEKQYSRFKADRPENRTYKNNYTTE